VGFPTDVTDEQWRVLEPLLVAPGKRGRKHGDLRGVIDALFYINHTGCQWRFLPTEFGPYVRVWSQFRRWRDSGMFDHVLIGVHRQVRINLGRQPEPSLIVIDPHLARGASHGGATFHDRGGPWGATKGAKRLVAVDMTGLPVAAMVVPASTNDGRATELLMDSWDFGERLEKVLVDRGTSKPAARRVAERHGVTVEIVGWDDPELDADGRRIFKPIQHAWRVEVAHGQIGRARRLSKSFENTTSSAGAWLALACIRLNLKALNPPE
jgi:putative transposase